MFNLLNSIAWELQNAITGSSSDIFFSYREISIVSSRIPKKITIWLTYLKDIKH